MELKELKKIFLKENMFNDIIGLEDVKKQIRSALLTGRHIILVGPPGIGKTTLAKNISAMLPEIQVYDDEFRTSIEKTPKTIQGKKPKKITLSGDERFIRVQGSPDLTVEDLIGDIDPIKAMKFGPLSLEAFTPGKIFKANNGILFFDEVNRCSEKLQNSLLQVLEEGKATIGSFEVDFDIDLLFIGTMNPKDFSTENLSDVFLDRFDLIQMGYPDNLDNEVTIVSKRGKKLLDMSENIKKTIIAFVRSLRNSSKLEKFPSVRASIGLYERVQSNALLEGRNNPNFKDIKEAMDSVLAHRIKLKPSIRYLQSPSEVLEEEFKAFAKANNIDLNNLDSESGSTEKESEVP
ncbi:MAG: AAA family ATPase [Candidatus Woesearchaeota archaeon]